MLNTLIYTQQVIFNLKELLISLIIPPGFSKYLQNTGYILNQVF